MILDNIEEIKKIDINNAYKAIELLPDQIRQVLMDSHKIKIPKEYSKVQNIVINGMGGSNLGARIVETLFNDQLKKPVLIKEGYSVPTFVNKDTLYILSSYSGNTEEILSTYNKVKKLGSKILAVTAKGNGKLEKLMIKNNIPGYIFDPSFNAGQEPRFAIGYAMAAISVVLNRAGLLKLDNANIQSSVQKMEIWNRTIRINIKATNNKAKQIAQKLLYKTPILVGAEFLKGNISAMRNQFCESAKNFASFLVLPDLNHFAMEGLANPKNNTNNLVFLFINSKLYDKRIQKRSELTKKIIRKNKINITDIDLKGKNKFEQSIELLQIGTYISYYLGILNKVNPSTNGFVDWLKENL